MHASSLHVVGLPRGAEGRKGCASHAGPLPAGTAH